MKFNIYAIKDNKKGVYLQPWFVPFYVKTEDVVIDFTRNLKSAESVISQFPDDFELCRLGEFMDETGVFTPCEKITIAVASDLLKEEKKENANSTESEII